MHQSAAALAKPTWVQDDESIVQSRTLASRSCMRKSCFPSSLLGLNRVQRIQFYVDKCKNDCCEMLVAPAPGRPLLHLTYRVYRIFLFVDSLYSSFLFLSHSRILLRQFFDVKNSVQNVSEKRKSKTCHLVARDRDREEREGEREKKDIYRHG